MTIEDRVRDALHDYADPIEPAPGSWERITARFDEPVGTTVPERRGPSRATVIFGVAALALVIVLIASLVVRDDGDDPSRIAAGSTRGMPSRILAVTASGTPAVLDATTGRRLSTYDVAGIVPGSQVAVTPNGSEVFVVKGATNETCGDHEILRLSTRDGGGGSRLVVNHATAPTVSPDGRTLAYLQCTAAGRYLAQRNVVTGEESLTGFPSGAEVDSRLAFSADGHVLFGLDGEMRELEYVPGESVPGHGLGIASWLVPRGGHADEYLVPKGIPGSVNLVRGREPSFTMSPLFRLPDDPTGIVSDLSGEHILAIVGDTLYRWSDGDAEPTKVADGITSAAWIADPPEEPAATVLPNGVAVVRRDGNVVVLGAPSGEVHSSLTTVPGDSVLSATADGRYLLIGGNRSALGCEPTPSPRLVRLDTRTSITDGIASGSYSPTVSSKGLVAYGYACDGNGLGMTRVATGDNYRTDPLGDNHPASDPLVTSVYPLGWSPDGTRLLYRAYLEQEVEPHYYVGRLWPTVDERETEVVELPRVGEAITAATFVDNETVALAVRTGDHNGLMIDGREEVALPGPVASLVADPSGRHFLIVTLLGDLYRWSRGEAEPTRLAEGVSSATWLPWS